MTYEMNARFSIELSRRSPVLEALIEDLIPRIPHDIAKKIISFMSPGYYQNFKEDDETVLDHILLQWKLGDDREMKVIRSAYNKAREERDVEQIVIMGSRFNDHRRYMDIHCVTNDVDFDDNFQHPVATCLMNMIIKSKPMILELSFKDKQVKLYSLERLTSIIDNIGVRKIFNLQGSRHHVMTKRQDSRYLKSIKNFDIRKRRQARLTKKALKENRE